MSVLAVMIALLIYILLVTLILQAMEMKTRSFAWLRVDTDSSH